MVVYGYLKSREVALEDSFQGGEHVLVRCVCAAVVVDDKLPLDRIVVHAFVVTSPSTWHHGSPVEFPAVTDLSGAVRMQSVFRNKVDEEGLLLREEQAISISFR